MEPQMTDEEILELGRKAIQRLKPTVFVICYTNKHENTISVYGGRQSAERAADDLMSHRISESWDQADKDTFDRLADFDLRLKFFHEVEQNVSYGEMIEVLERVVGA
jgi:hypothetical protein